MKHRYIFSIALVLGILLGAGCDDELNYETYKANEERYFELYMQKNYPDLQPNDSGLYFIGYEEGNGETPDTGDWVLINYLAKLIPSEEVVDTYTEDWAREYGIYDDEVLYGPYKYKLSTAIKGLRLGISMLKEGGEARLIFKSDLGYGETEVGDIGKFQSLLYDVQLVEVIPDPEVREQEQIDAYLAANPGYVTIEDPDSDAVMYYFEETVGDSTVYVEEGHSAEVFYTGQLLDGREFDSNAGSYSGFKVTVGDEDVIKGWDLGLPYFRFGGTGKLLIPHELAYGESGRVTGSMEKHAIPPYEALLFDIEVTKKTYE